MLEINFEKLFHEMRDKSARFNRFHTTRADEVREGESGGVVGPLNVCGVMDSWRSVVFPGAWAPHTKGFVKDGKMLYGHRWNDPEIGVVLAADERVIELDGQNRSVLWWDAEFHDDATAQRIRGITAKRWRLQKTVDFSVGFWPDWSETAEFKNGQDLWDFAKGKGCDMSLFDPAIQKDKGWCWAIPKVNKNGIAEGSIVNDGATPGSEATDVRTMFNDLSSGALAASLPDHLDTVLAAVQGVTSRVRSVRARRVEDSRELSSERVAQVDMVLAALQELRAECTASLQQPAEPDDLAKRLDDLELLERFAAHSH